MLVESVALNDDPWRTVFTRPSITTDRAMLIAPLRFGVIILVAASLEHFQKPTSNRDSVQCTEWYLCATPVHPGFGLTDLPWTAASPVTRRRRPGHDRHVFELEFTICAC